MRILPSDNSYSTFCRLTSGYRMFSVLREALRTGIIDRVAEGSSAPDFLAESCGLKTDEGKRFIELLVNVGLLEQYDGLLYLSRFAATYLATGSPLNQRHVLEFEELLMENWGQLSVVLAEGQGVLTREQPLEEYQRRLALFQGAMGETARVRAVELWEALPPLPESGLIIDVGAGDGSYLRAFLERHPSWQGIACDLPDVCTAAECHPPVENLRWYPVNILNPDELAALVAGQRGEASLLLLSNLIHCYSPTENRALLEPLRELVATDGQVVVHDFFRDGNDVGALYDLHMLVNTYNGRCYTLIETAGLMDQAGFPQQSVLELSSGSHAVVVAGLWTVLVDDAALLRRLRTTVEQITDHRFNIASREEGGEPEFMLVNDSHDGSCWLWDYAHGRRFLEASEPVETRELSDDIFDEGTDRGPRLLGS